MAVLDLLDFSRKRSAGGSATGGARADRLFSIDGVLLDPAPARVNYKDAFRVNTRQVLAGQIGNKGGLGGCQISVSGRVDWKKAGFLKELRDLFAERSGDESFMVFYDPIQALSFEALCPEAELEMNVIEPHFYHYSFTLLAQVLGRAWTSVPLVGKGIGSAVSAFDLLSLDTMVNDAQAFNENWAKAQKQQGNNGGSGSQPATGAQ